VTHREPPARKPDLPPSFEARITPTRRSVAAGPAGGSGPDYWVIEGAPLRPVLANLYDISERRIDLATTLDSSTYDFVLVLPQSVSRERMIDLMREPQTMACPTLIDRRRYADGAPHAGRRRMEAVITV